MKRHLVLAASVALGSLVVFGGLPPGGAGAATPAPGAVRAATDATKAARQITFNLAHGAGGSGTIRMYTIGRTRTRIVLTIPHGEKYRVRLYPGSDCNTNRAMAASAVALTPMNSAGVNAPHSQTIVSLPIERLSGNYVVDVRDATERADVLAACAHLSP